jgi:nitrogen fixation/metabolism regulation signal transduction histidine kinase
MAGAQPGLAAGRIILKSRRQTGTVPLNLLILILFYILLVILILIFFQQIINNITGGNTLAVILVAIVFPVILLGIIIFNIVKLIRERAVRQAGARFKTRLILFFSFIAFLSIVPQALLSVSFINSVISSWISSPMGDALDGGVKISLAYRGDKDANLNRFSRSPMLSYLLEDLTENPEKSWQNIQDANPEINLFHVFNDRGEELIYKGRPEGRTSDYADIKGEKELLRRHQVIGDLSILKVLVNVNIEGQKYHVVLGITYPKLLDEYASLMTETRSFFTSLFRFRDMFRTALALFYILFSFPVLLIAILVSFLLTDEIIKPVANLEQATKRIAEGDFSFRILTRTRDELSTLAASFNRMISELETSRNKLIQAEKISAWKEIAQRLAHEIKNPLTPIKLSAQRLLRKYKSDPESLNDVLEPSISAIINEVDNLNQLLTDFREFTKLPDPSPEPTEMKELVEEVISIYRNLSQKVVFHYLSLNNDTVVKVDSNQIRQVFANLIKNAVQAMPEGGEISIITDFISKNANQYFRIQMRDTGIGMDEDIQDKIFEPYFSTKKGGVGLGLSIVERIIFDHNGDIWFETKKGSGTTFFIDLPLEK